MILLTWKKPNEVITSSEYFSQSPKFHEEFLQSAVHIAPSHHPGKKYATEVAKQNRYVV
jgi:hypothetical protein